MDSVENGCRGTIAIILKRNRRESDQDNTNFIQNNVSYYMDQTTEIRSHSISILNSAKAGIFGLIVSKIVSLLESLQDELIEIPVVLTSSPKSLTAESLANSLQQWRRKLLNLHETLLTEITSIHSTVQTQLDNVEKEIKTLTTSIFHNINMRKSPDGFKSR